LVHCVLLCSLLATWLGRPVDVVASLGTHMVLVCSYPQPRGILPIRLRQLSGPTSNATHFLQSSAQSLRSFKVESSTFSFSRFRNSQKFNFADFHVFRFFDSMIAAPLPGRGGDVLIRHDIGRAEVVRMNIARRYAPRDGRPATGERCSHRNCKNGQLVYGYGYVKKTPTSPPALAINESEAAVVRGS
jgi:hypothetical protein